MVVRSLLSDAHTLDLRVNGNLTTAKFLNPELLCVLLKDLQPIPLRWPTSSAKTTSSRGDHRSARRRDISGNNSITSNILHR